MRRDPRGFYRVMGYPLPSSDPHRFARCGDQAEPQPSDYPSINKDVMATHCARIEKLKLYCASTPFLRAVYVCNSLSFEAGKETSDIDVVCVVDPGYLWVARAWLTIILLVTGQKRMFGGSSAGKVCLSFWLDSSSLNLFPLSLSPLDYYLIYWIAHCVPIYLRDGEQDVGLLRRANSWIDRWLPGTVGYVHTIPNLLPRIGSVRFFAFLPKLFGSKRLGPLRWFLRISQIFLMIVKRWFRKEKYTIVSDTVVRTYRDQRQVYNTALGLHFRKDF
ncbi:MAG: hypothetical protein NZL83_01000 [Candidatus Absconditabacterales bacterium]|nr:hypothetical protein [Candidatus Absconditabacterales bacterium]